MDDWDVEGRVKGREVVFAREALGLTRAQLAGEFGVSERSVRRWEDEGVDGPPEVALRLARRLRYLGQAWRVGEVTIRMSAEGIQMEEPWW